MMRRGRESNRTQETQMMLSKIGRYQMTDAQPVPVQ